MTGDRLEEPIDVGDRFRWRETGDGVEVLSMHITEDAVTQIRVSDGDERRTVTASDLVERVETGDLRRVEEEPA